MFKTYGIKSVTMDDIAARMGISKKTLYQQVSDRNELISRVLENEYHQFTHQLTTLKLASNNALDQLTRLYLHILRYLKQISPSAVTDLQKQYPKLYSDANSRFKALISENLEVMILQGETEGLIRLDADEKLIARLHTEKIEQYKANFENAEESLLHQKYYKEMIEYYLRGLISPKGEPVLQQLITEFDNYLK